MKDFLKRAESASKFYKFRAQATNQWVPHIRWNRQIDKSQYSVKPTKAISFRRRIMWKTTALRMWNTTIDFMKSYMNPLESSCMLHRTGWIRNSKRTESTKLTKQTDSSAVALLVPICSNISCFFCCSPMFFLHLQFWWILCQFLPRTKSLAIHAGNWSSLHHP